jgi:ADP-heptose:LPS heptosyltransferase
MLQLFRSLIPKAGKPARRGLTPPPSRPRDNVSIVPRPEPHPPASNIIVAPFSNSHIRDWPAEKFAELIELLARRWSGPGMIRVIGTSSQSIRACDIVRRLDPARVSNDCGVLSWPQVLAELKQAACVIGNNSGIVHLGGHYGAPTVCIFSGSHQRLEWRPSGFSVVTLSRSIGCSPCHLDHGARCPYNKACLQKIEPETVADVALALMAQRDAEKAVASA